MKHAYVISETIKEVQGMPNVRDHDYSLYFRIQGQLFKSCYEAIWYNNQFCRAVTLRNLITNLFSN